MPFCTVLKTCLPTGLYSLLCRVPCVEHLAPPLGGCVCSLLPDLCSHCSCICSPLSAAQLFKSYLSVQPTYFHRRSQHAHCWQHFLSTSQSLTRSRLTTALWGGCCSARHHVTNEDSGQGTRGEAGSLVPETCLSLSLSLPLSFHSESCFFLPPILPLPFFHRHFILSLLLYFNYSMINTNYGEKFVFLLLFLIRSYGNFL